MKRLLAILLLCLPAFAQTTVSGTLQTASGNPNFRNAAVRFSLLYCGNNQPKVAGVALFNTSFDAHVTSSGQVKDELGNPLVIYGNDVITCGATLGGTRWQWTPIFNGVAGISCRQYINGPAWDLNQQLCDNANPAPLAPVGSDLTHLRIDASNSPVTGTPVFAAGLTTTKVNGIAYADSYVNIQAAVNAAAGLVIIPNSLATTTTPESLTMNGTKAFLDLRGWGGSSDVHANFGTVTGTDFELGAYGRATPAGEGPSFACQNFDTNATTKNLNCSLVFRHGSTASPVFTGGIRSGWILPAGTWQGDPDVITPDTNAGGAGHSRLRIGIGGGVIIHPAGNTNNFQLNPQVAISGGYEFVVNQSGSSANLFNVKTSEVQVKTMLNVGGVTTPVGKVHVNCNGFDVQCLTVQHSAAAGVTHSIYNDVSGNGMVDVNNTSGVNKVRISGADGAITTVGQFVSTATTGTAPIVTPSTTVVTNLNADMVDGKHAIGAGDSIPSLDATGIVAGCVQVDTTGKQTSIGTPCGVGGGGTGDVTGPGSSVTNEVVLMNGATGKVIKSSSLTGIPLLTAGVISGSNVTNDVQTKAAIVPNTAPAAGEIPVGNAGGTAYAKQALSGDCTLASTGAITCTKTSGSSFVASATTDTTSATNIGSGTLADGRLSANVPLLNAANVFSHATGQSMTKLLLPGSSSGTLTVLAAAAAGTNTLTLPAGTTDFSATGGTAKVVFQTTAGGPLTVARPTCSTLFDAAASCATDTTVATNITSGTLPDAQLATKYKTSECGAGIGDGLNAIAAGTYIVVGCYNGFGATYTITAVKAYADGGSSTVNLANDAAGALLTGAVTATTGFAAGTQSGTTTIASAHWIVFTIVADGTSKHIQAVVVTTR